MPAKLKTQNNRSEYLTALSTGVYAPGSSEYQDVLSVISRHSCFARKSAAGLTGIRIAFHPQYKRYKVVYIQHTDGTSTDIRFVKPYPSPAAKETAGVRCALRHAIRDQTFGYKKTSFTPGMACANCYEELVWSETQVDHVVKFRDLCSTFLNAHGHHKHPLVDNRESGVVFGEDDAEYMQTWQKYHKQHAKLQLLCAACNRKLR